MQTGIWENKNATKTALSMPQHALAQFTKRLRSEFDLGTETRLRRATRQGREVFQLMHSTGGKAQTTQLEATDELGAYEAAKLLLAGQPTSKTRVPSYGTLRRAEIEALQAIEESGGRVDPRIAASRAVQATVAYLTEHGQLLTAESLLGAIRATDASKRERRSRIQAARLLAEAGGINLKVPKGLLYVPPGPKKRRVREPSVYGYLHELDALPDYACWLFRVVACTGCRANSVFSMEIPPRQITPGTKIWYIDNKRSKPGKPAHRSFTTPTLNFRGQSAWNVWELWNVPPRILEIQHQGRRATDEETRQMNLLTAEVQRRLRVKLPEARDIITFRNLRHLTVKRLLKRDVPAEQVSQLVSTSVEQLHKTYDDLFRQEAAEAAGQAFDFAVPSTPEDVKRALDKL